MFKDRSKILFIATILASAYTIYLISYFGGSMTSSDTAEAVGGAIATALVTPHMLLMGLGAAFGWVSFITKKSWGALVAAILYCAGGILFILYIMFCIPIIILGFVGYSKQKKIVKGSK